MKQTGAITQYPSHERVRAVIMNGSRVNTAVDYDILFQDFDIASPRKISEYVPESLSVVLLDKDNILFQLPPRNDSDYMIEHPVRDMLTLIMKWYLGCELSEHVEISVYNV